MTKAGSLSMPHWPRLMCEPLAAKYLGISPTSLREHGPEPRRWRRRLLYDIHDLNRWADALAGEPLDEEQRDDEGDDIHARVMERLKHG